MTKLGITFRISLPRATSKYAVLATFERIEKDIQNLNSEANVLIFILEVNERKWEAEVDVSVPLNTKKEAIAQLANEIIIQFAEKWPEERFTTRLIYDD